MLRAVVNHSQSNWEELLPLCEFAFNDMKQCSTCATPIFLNYGQHPVSTPDVLLPSVGVSPNDSAQSWLSRQQSAIEIARDSIHDAILKQEYYANRTRRNRPFRVVDKVPVHRDFISTPVSRDQPCSKLRPRWFGPFTVTNTYGATVKLDLPASCRAHPVFNTAAIKLYHEDPMHPAPAPPPPVFDLDGHERFIVDSVLSDKRFRGKDQYLVKWEGYPEPTWEPKQNLLDESG